MLFVFLFFRFAGQAILSPGRFFAAKGKKNISAARNRIRIAEIKKLNCFAYGGDIHYKRPKRYRLSIYSHRFCFFYFKNGLFIVFVKPYRNAASGYKFFAADSGKLDAFNPVFAPVCPAGIFCRPPRMRSGAFETFFTLLNKLYFLRLIHTKKVFARPCIIRPISSQIFSCLLADPLR